MKRNILIGIWLWVSCMAMAQQIIVTAPSKVSVGENFRVAYKVTTQDVDEFRSGMRSTDEVEVIAGPYTSLVSNYNMINGHASSSSSITYTYTLYANKAGTFNVPAARVMDKHHILSLAKNPPKSRKELVERLSSEPQRFRSLLLDKVAFALERAEKELENSTRP